MNLSVRCIFKTAIVALLSALLSSTANADVPIFMAHGLHDEMIGIERALSSRDALEALGYAPAWHEYPMAHAVCEEEVTAIAGWLAGVL